MSLSKLPSDLLNEVLARADRLSPAMGLRGAVLASITHSTEVRRIALSEAYAKGLAGQSEAVTFLTQITLLQLAAKDLP